MENVKIGFFDSGIGGVTVLKECIKINPEFQYIYYSDSKNNPYGDKTKEEIIKISRDIVEKLINDGCQIIVIACNTASAMASAELRKEFKIPIIAIEPAIKLAYDKSGATLVMATKGTLESEKFHQLYKNYHNDETHILPCVGLANLIENNEIEKIDDYLKRIYEEYKDKNIRNIVLGCTHYPIIKDKIKYIFNDAEIFDGAEGVARQLKKVALSHQTSCKKNTNDELVFIDSSESEEKKKRFFQLLK